LANSAFIAGQPLEAGGSAAAATSVAIALNLLGADPERGAGESREENECAEKGGEGGGGDGDEAGMRLEFRHTRRTGAQEGFTRLLGRRHGEEGGEARVAAEAVADAQKHHLAWPNCEILRGQFHITTW